MSGASYGSLSCVTVPVLHRGSLNSTVETAVEPEHFRHASDHTVRDKNSEQRRCILPCIRPVLDECGESDRQESLLDARAPAVTRLFRTEANGLASYMAIAPHATSR